MKIKTLTTLALLGSLLVSSLPTYSETNNELKNYDSNLVYLQRVKELKRNIEEEQQRQTEKLIHKFQE